MVFLIGRRGATAASRMRTSGMLLASASRASSKRPCSVVYRFSAIVTSRRSRASSMARGGICSSSVDADRTRRASSFSRVSNSLPNRAASEGIVRRRNVWMSSRSRCTGGWESVYRLRRARSSACFLVSSSSACISSGERWTAAITMRASEGTPESTRAASRRWITSRS